MARKANTGATFTMMHHGRVTKSIAPAGVLVAVIQLRYEIMLPFQGDPTCANVLAADQAEFVLSGFPTLDRIGPPRIQLRRRTRARQILAPGCPDYLPRRPGG
jgi:hypothetical protein